MKTIQEVKDFYTIESKEDNRYSEFTKLFRCYTRSNKFLPSQKYVYPFETRLPWKKNDEIEISYFGTLTDEQSFIFDIIKRRHEEYNYSCGLVHFGTGKGKSHIIMSIAAYFKTKTIILCHNIKTLKEMVTNFEKFCGYTPGQYYGVKQKFGDITITTHDSFVSQGGFPGMFDVILYDEADHGLSKPMLHALCESDAKALYGFTGTPFRNEFDVNDMQKIYGKIIEYKDGPKYNMLPTIIQYQYYSPNRSSYEYMNWAEQRDCLMRDEDRMETQIKIVKEYVSKGRKTMLLLTDRVEEAKMFTENMIKACPELQVLLVTGETKVKDDEIGISTYVGKTQTLIIGTSGKMARGVDVPAIDTVFLFTPLKFKGTVVQAVGRGLRKYPGKDDVLLIDFSDRPMLYLQSVQRITAYKEEYGIDKDSIEVHTIKNKT